MDTDVLVGLRFEISGGLGKMSGVVVGKAGSLYLVQKDDAQHLELLELSDLKVARFYRGSGAVGVTASGGAPIAGGEPAAVRSTGGRLSDKIRRTASRDD